MAGPPLRPASSKRVLGLKASSIFDRGERDRAATLVSLGDAGRGRRRAALVVASLGFSTYVSKVGDVGQSTARSRAPSCSLLWLWLTNVALLLGAELNAEIERERELGEGVPRRETLNRPARRG